MLSLKAVAERRHTSCSKCTVPLVSPAPLSTQTAFSTIFAAVLTDTQLSVETTKVWKRLVGGHIIQTANHNQIRSRRRILIGRCL